jgi:hypothetical protein
MSFRQLHALPACFLHHFLSRWALPLCLSIAGCEAAQLATPFGAGDVSQGSGGAGGGGSGSAGTQSGGGGSIDFGTDAGGGLEEDAACASTSVEADLIPLDMLILLDRSGSMYGDNWNGATGAISQFVVDPASAGIHAGIVYFPIDNPSDGKMCNHEHYDMPVIPIAELPLNGTKIVQSISAESPNGGGTPMYGALRGALAYATAYQDSHPAHEMVVVLASDGDPNSCSQMEDQIGTIAELAEKAYDYNGVETYVIAISGSTLANLNQIAAKGGTGLAYDVTVDIGLFSQKMSEIRAAALSCEFVIPAAPKGETLEHDKVAVKYASGNQMQKEIPRVLGAQACGAQGGWYYDDLVMPSKIVLCPASCDAVKADPDAKISVYFGCTPTIL